MREGFGSLLGALERLLNTVCKIINAAVEMRRDLGHSSLPLGTVVMCCLARHGHKHVCVTKKD